jgi:hypothetical protein
MGDETEIHQNKSFKIIIHGHKSGYLSIQSFQSVPQPITFANRPNTLTVNPTSPNTISYTLIPFRHLVTCV